MSKELINRNRTYFCFSNKMGQALIRRMLGIHSNPAEGIRLSLASESPQPL